MELDTLDKLKRARVQIQRNNPFFAYLSLYLKFREAKNELPEYAGMGVSADGDLVYNKVFVDKLTEKELMGVLVHEILHLAYLHLTRRKSRQPQIWNIAADIVVNQVLKDNGYSLPEGAILSDYRNEVRICGVTIDDCNKKTAEFIYDELEKKLPKQGSGGGKGKGKGGSYGDYGKDAGGHNYDGFDAHNYGDPKEGRTQEEIKKIEDYWKGKAEEALVTAKLRGNVPSGVERVIGGLHEAKVGWRSILQKYVQRAIPYDYTYASPSKKSVATGVYMPNTIKDYINVTIAVDTSGSIGQEELSEFLSEIIGISKAFSSRVKMKVLTHDVKVWDDYDVHNGQISKIQQIKIRGGGGTSHKEVFEYIEKNIKSCRLLICFTDGDSDLQEIETDKFRFDKLFVISENGHDRQLEGKNVNIIKLKDYKYEN